MICPECNSRDIELYKLSHECEDELGDVCLWRCEECGCIFPINSEWVSDEDW